MPINHTIENEVTVVNSVPATVVIDATPVASATDLDTRSYDPGSRFMLIMDAFETVGTNTGGSWVVQESETDGGTYTASTTSGSLAATGAVAGNVQRVVSFLPNPAKPFVQVVFTGTTAAADVDISANFVIIGRGGV